MVKNEKPNRPRDSVTDAAEVIDRFRNSMMREAERLTETQRQLQRALAPSAELMATAHKFSERARAISQENERFAAQIRNVVSPTKLDFARLSESRLAFDKLLSPKLGFEKILGPRVDLDKLLGPKINFDSLVAATRVELDKLLGSRIDFEKVLRTQVMTQRFFETLQSTLNDTRPQVAELRERLTSAVTASVGELATRVADGPREVVTAPVSSGSGASSEKHPHRDLAWIEWLRGLPAALQITVLILVLLVLEPLVAAAWSQLVARWLQAERPQEQRALISETQNYFGADAVDSLRCVRARNLRVREAPSTDASIVGRLASGQSVEIVETERGWSLVRYRDQTSGELKEGWAASGYLVGFTC